MALVLIMEVERSKSSWHLAICLVMALPGMLLNNGCLHTRGDDLTSPRATVLIQLQPMDLGRFKAARKIIRSTIENRSTTEFRYSGPKWRLKRLNRQARYGTCRVYFRSSSLNRAEVLQRAEAVVEVLKERLKREDLGPFVRVDIE
jgi:hypothetical protein